MNYMNEDCRAQTEQPEQKKIRLKIVIRRDVAMEALKNQGESVRDSFSNDAVWPSVSSRRKYTTPEVTIMNADTGEEIEGVQDVKLEFNAFDMAARVIFTVINPEIDIHIDSADAMLRNENEQDCTILNKELLCGSK